MKQINRVVEALKEGPATSAELVADTGLSIKHVSAYLSDLAAVGTVVVVGQIGLGVRGRPFNIYALKEHV